MQKKNLQRIVLPVLVFILVIGGWEIYVRAFHISLYILPAPSKVIQALVQNRDILMKHSIGMDLSKTIRTSLYPYLIVTQTVPVMVLGPLFSIWFGFDLLPKVLIVVFMCFFPIAVSLTDALQQIDPKKINLVKSFGASTFQVHSIVKIPAGATGLFSGLKVAATYCVGGAIVGEWLSSSAGLGYYMLRVKNGYMLDKVFACVLLIVLWSVLLNVGVSILEKLCFPYLRKGEGK